MSQAAIQGIEYCLPENELSNAQLSAQFPEWSVDKIEAKTGIRSRRIVQNGECASDLALRAAEKLFDGGFPRESVDFILLCTQSPDYFLPTTACCLQDRLGISTSAGALDFNLGCSGFVYGLGLAKGLIESHQAENVLLLTAETYSKFVADDDKSARTIFGDGAAATMVSAVSHGTRGIQQIAYGTDGRGAKNLIVRGGGMRNPGSECCTLEMDGGEVFVFTLSSVPSLVEGLLQESNCSLSDVDLFVFHQANRYMIDHLRRKIGIPKEKFVVHLADVGNTVSSTIPIALKHAIMKDRIMPGDRIMLVGFGVGYSWAAAMVEW